MSATPSKHSNSPFSLYSYHKLQEDIAQRCIEKDMYIKQLEEILVCHGIELPPHVQSVVNTTLRTAASYVLKEGNFDELRQFLENQKQLTRDVGITIEFHDLNFTTMVDTEKKISSVGSVLSSLFSFWKCPEKKEVKILCNATGRIIPGRMTLLIGPPGSGKSVLLRAIAGRLHYRQPAQLTGDVYYNGDNIHSGNFLVNKVADYIEQGDTHEAVLTVDETLKFAWQCTTGGRHSYAKAKDLQSGALLDQENNSFNLVRNVQMALGLVECKDTMVGSAIVRGISGGQKRRVTIGEAIVCPRPVKMMDSISNGLDSATTFDIIRSLRAVTSIFGITNVVSLLQVSSTLLSLSFHPISLLILLCVCLRAVSYIIPATPGCLPPVR